MSEPFLAEVRIVGFNFAPRGWAQCDGQLLPINQYQSLYSLLGTTYGGDGRTTFGLPELRGRVPIHVGDRHTQGQKGGVESVSLLTDQIPSHTHTLNALSDDADSNMASGNQLAKATTLVYENPTSLTAMESSAIANAGGGQAHTNMQPYQTLNFVIALQGLFPSRN